MRTFDRELITGIKTKSRVHNLPIPRIPHHTAFDILEAFLGPPIRMKPRTRASLDLVSRFCDVLILDNNWCIIPHSHHAYRKRALNCQTRLIHWLNVTMYFARGSETAISQLPARFAPSCG